MDTHYQPHSDECYSNSILTVPLIIDNLKRLNETPGFVYYSGIVIDYTFSFTNGCAIDEVSAFEKSIGYNLPDDYKEFLHFTDGLRLSVLAVSQLLDISSMIECRNVYHFVPKNILFFGELYDGDIYAAIKLDEKPDRCICIYQILSEEPIKELHCSFTDFLDRFITTYGQNFWDWCS